MSEFAGRIFQTHSKKGYVRNLFLILRNKSKEIKIFKKFLEIWKKRNGVKEK